MKRLLILAAAGMLAMAALAAPQPHIANPISEKLQIAWLEHQWTQAAASANRPVLDDLLDDQFFEILPGNVRRTRHDLLTAPPLPAGGSQVLEDVHVQILGNVAVVTGINRYTPAAGYTPIEYRFTDVFLKREAGWRIVTARMRHKEAGGV
ncbi:nuclear transport factor 2 family protein [Paraburkholderia ferrariae]|uniref:nuclear transport factor 2 family protein n=1 Tax=Paraburkholderia ferrariae TaxID=386056 RepID=UPI000485CB43|nr:nuclear transport factor 2 family protein [Paraburkholderia ferrariae]